MNQPVKAFNEQGITAFQELVRQETEQFDSSGIRGSFPTHLMNDPTFVEDRGSLGETQAGATVDFSKTFTNKFEFGVYLMAQLGGGADIADAGLWCWLANGYMDKIAPTAKAPGAVERYIPSDFKKTDTNWFGKTQRHLTRMPYEVIRDMQSGRLDPDFSKLLLSSAVSAVGSFLEICASRNQIMRNRKIQETAFKLYGKSGTVIKPKRGFDGHTSKSDPTNKKGRGGLRRFSKTIVPRIRENHDLEVITPDEFIDAWGPEVVNSSFYP